MQEKNLEKRIDDLASRLKENEDRFSRHQEMYVNDRKELKEQMDAIVVILTPMSEAFKGSKFTADLFVSFFKFITVFGGGVGLIIVGIAKLKEFLN